MQHKKLKLSFLLLLCLGVTGLYAQDAIPATGGDATGSGGTASYSVGQVIFTTFNGTNGSEAQGVQQPYEISVVIGLEEANGITLQCTAYPNPANDFLTLKVKNHDLMNLSYQLIDMNGKVLVSKKNDGHETTIDMRNIASGTYFLKIYTIGNKELKTFKIIKQQ